MILIDPPTWPAHGTVFSHLVSDRSRAELHEFALRSQLPAGAFDRDHYDVAEQWYDQLLGAGAVPVSARELVTRLRASGLRRTKQTVARERAGRIEELRHAWQELDLGAPGLRDRMLADWGARSRRYHDQQHLAEALAAISLLTPHPSRELRLAVWFHDAVYAGEPGADEEASAQLAEQSLGGLLPSGSVAEVARLVRLTASHAPAGEDTDGMVLNDADLSILAAEPERYAGYTAGVRAEYHHVPPAQFVRGRTAVLEDLLGRDRLFATARGRELWEEAARQNLQAELSGLRR